MSFFKRDNVIEKDWKEDGGMRGFFRRVVDACCRNRVTRRFRHDY